MKANLVLPIGRDLRAAIFFIGPEPTQDNIRMLIKHLELSLDTYAEAAPVSVEDPATFAAPFEGDQ